MASYKEVLAQAQALMAQAEEMRKTELESVVQEILGKMAEYQISFEDLRAAQGNKPRRTIKKPDVKYRGPAGQTWSGRVGSGQGAAMAAGRNR